jgi:large conductance mechanosensitive channel
MSFASEFKEFALKGNVVDLAVGVIIGAAFGKIVDSIVKDLIMPVIGRLIGGLDFSNYFIALATPPANYTGPMTYEALTKAGVPLFAHGNFTTVAVNFVILALIVFIMIRQINQMKLTASITPAAAAAPEDVVPLREIRDAVKK